MSKKNKRGSWIATFTGRRFDALHPRSKDIDIRDIAHALSNVCRYTGHVRKFMSVGQHSVYVSRCVPEEDALWGLLHDASEAYIADIARPIKHTPVFAEYRKLEAKVMKVIVKHFGLPKKEPESVRLADQRMVATEKRDLMPAVSGWKLELEPYKFKITSWSPSRAKAEFLDRFEELTRKKK